MARGLAKQRKLAAFGDGRKIIWDHNSEAIFRGNPNIARPGDERTVPRRLHWIKFHRGHRIYNDIDANGERWIWNYDFRPTPGEMFFQDNEKAFAVQMGKGFVVIEPNVPEFKSVAPNKQWPVSRYQEIARHLRANGREVVQFAYGGKVELEDVRQIKTKSFRLALAVLARASLYIGPEGGLHHGAAAVGVPAVVLFGGFIPPVVTGYPQHVNLTGGAEACGSLNPCAHCKKAMEAITCEEVLWGAWWKLDRAA